MNQTPNPHFQTHILMASSCLTLLLMSSDVHVVMKLDPFPSPPSHTRTHASKQLSGDIMQLSPWRSAGDGPSLDNVKNVRLSLSICRFDFSLESCWEPEKMWAFGNAHARALKVRFKGRIYEKCWHASWIRELTFKKKKTQLFGFVSPRKDFESRTFIWTRKSTVFCKAEIPKL